MITVKNTTEGIIPNLEIKGNTVQNPANLSDIKSCGVDNGDGTYSVDVVSCSKNLVNFEIEKGRYSSTTGEKLKDDVYLRSVDMIKCSHLQGKQVQFSFKYKRELKTTVHFTQFDKNRKFIRDTYQANGNYTIPNDVAYVAFTLYVYLQEGQPQLVDITDIQLEEGVEVTPFEECKQSKCTIKLPCQLEKGGDFSDRLYFDKVENAWCIDKVVMTYNKLLTHIAKSYNKMDNTTMWYISKKDLGGNIYAPRHGVISNLGKRADNTNTVYNKDIDGAIAINADDSMSFQIRLSNSITDGNKYLDDNKLTVKCVRNEPQKIVLPLDAQIMLNQFLGTTNVWLECGEVDGTIKATFSKSMASTVQANTKAINDMDNRVKGIEGLKESQDMAYATDKGYLVCKETKNGTIKDLKISGKSLLSLCPNFEINYTASSDYDGYQFRVGQSYDTISPRKVLQDIEPNTQYTIVCNVINMGDSGDYMINNPDATSVFSETLRCVKGINVFHVTSKTELTNAQAIALRCQNRNCRGNVHIKDIMILKGHIQNPPSYFEGIASVGNEVDKIEVSSCWGNGNLVDNIKIFKDAKFDNINGDSIIKLLSKGAHDIFDDNVQYIVDYNIDVIEGSNSTFAMIKYKDGSIAYATDSSKPIKTIKPVKSICWTYGYNCKVKNAELIINKIDMPKTNVHKSDKKPILFKDTDGNWKPISELRGLDTVCDTIELHADGKYYYHVRTGKDILKGSEGFTLYNTGGEDTSCIGFRLVNSSITGETVNGIRVISDKLKSVSNYLDINKGLTDGVYAGYNALVIGVSKSRLETQDVEGFKKWLQSNNLTVIYQLSEEKVFEVNPLFLEAFEGETMVSVDSGVINAPVEFKLTSYLPNIVKLNEKRISKLENDFYQYTVVQNRLALTSRYNADRVDFKVDNTIGNPLRSSKALDHDLFNLMKVNIEVGKENYNRVEMEEKMDFYVNEGIIDWDMWDELFEAMELQHNPPVDLTPIEPITTEINEEETPKKTRRGRKKKVVEEI